MAIVSHLDKELRCTFVVWFGDTTPQQWRAHFDELIHDPEFPPGRSWLTDASRANVDLFDDAVIADMGARMNKAAAQLGGIQMAIVANGAWPKASKLIDEEVAVRGLTAIQFARFETACVWLGIPVDEARTIVDDLRTSGETT